MAPEPGKTPGLLRPDWPLPPGVGALYSTRDGGVSLPPYRSLNLGDHVGDDPAAVAANRSLLRRSLPGQPVWLRQVHGLEVIDVAQVAQEAPEADAAVAFAPGRVCAVLTADCLPVLFARDDGSAVGAAHAGWRGLAGGVLEATVEKLGGAAGLSAWLGPAIGPEAFEVGAEVREAFLAHDAAAEMAFRPTGLPGKWWADLYRLARLRLAALGVERVYGGGACTVSEAERYFSYRRDGRTGRMACLVWLE
ncbi:peptidoglycan editing factor PgeF [Chitinimonas lacunae]|uniref:Purine nucleoside phosphorylase n=1 Tax=Chitinimonas lacunae TaxID=1963018 RepID=A0ABV8MPB2_9NEIS